VNGHKVENFRRVGNLEKGKPISFGSETLKWAGKMLASFL